MFPESKGVDLELAQNMQQAEKLKDISISILGAFGSQYFPEFGLIAIKGTLLPIKDFLEKTNRLNWLEA